MQLDFSYCIMAWFVTELSSFSTRADNPKHFYTNHQCDEWDKYKTTWFYFMWNRKVIVMYMSMYMWVGWNVIKDSRSPCSRYKLLNFSASATSFSCKSITTHLLVSGLWLLLNWIETKAVMKSKYSSLPVSLSNWTNVTIVNRISLWILSNLFAG